MEGGSIMGIMGTVAVSLLAMAAAPAARAEQDSGRELYVRYCGACHGPEGKGDGIASSFMRPSPPNLTLLAKGHEGTFPLDDVAKAIDGREMPRVHGDPWMPVWGTKLGEQLGGGDKPSPAVEGQVRGRILAIAEYLRTIQAH